MKPSRAATIAHKRAAHMVALATVLVIGSNAMLASASAPPTNQPADRAFVPGRILVRFKAGIGANSAAERAALQATRTSVITRLSDVDVTIVRIPLNARETDHLAMLRNRPEVEFAELDEIVPPDDLTPNDPIFGQSQWGPVKIGCPSAWTSSSGSEAVVIAVLDSGIDSTHPDLVGKLVPGWNIYSNNSNTADVTGHGTSVAGVAAAATNNGIGVAGVAWNCRIMPIRISATNGTATYTAAASGITWAAQHGARVVNISYNMSLSNTVRTAAQAFQDAGGVVVLSSGNASYVESSPDNPYVLTVSATDASDQVPAWSNTGNNVDLAAPGVNIYTTTTGGHFGVGSGTSYAAPMVAGVAALLISSNPSLTGWQIQAALKQSADDLGAPGWDTKYGCGRLNAAQALTLAASGTLPSTPPSPPPSGPAGGNGDTTPPTVAITTPSNGATISGQVPVTSSCADNIKVTKAELYVDGVLKASSTKSPFTMKWNSNTASSGSHTLAVRAYDAAGNVGTSAGINVVKP